MSQGDKSTTRPDVVHERIIPSVFFHPRIFLLYLSSSFGSQVTFQKYYMCTGKVFQKSQYLLCATAPSRENEYIGNSWYNSSTK